jgi:flavin reductase (DIM6/NTAB) family NADH-FMN oxidoreductase RutF
VTRAATQTPSRVFFWQHTVEEGTHMSSDQAQFRKTMSQFATGVTIVTASVGEERGGLTLNSFNSVSLTPPLVSICVTNGTHSHDLISRSGAFCVNILSSTQEALARRFATVPGEQRFDGIDTVPSPLGSPLIPDAIAWLDARIVHRYEGGDHTIFIAEAGSMQIAHPDARPLLYFRSAFTSL